MTVGNAREPHRPQQSLVFAGVLAVTAMSCGGSAGTPDGRPATEELAPQWLRTAVAESTSTMTTRCDDFAPLEIVGTHDPLYVACEKEAAHAAFTAWNAVYVEALRQCTAAARTGVRAGCCFARVPDLPSFVALAQQRCNEECSGIRSGEPPAHCASVVVAPVRPSMGRTYTPGVASVAAVCQNQPTEVSRCRELGSYVERKRCEAICVSRDPEFESGVRQCIRDSEATGDQQRCPASLKPAVRDVCDSWCREQAELSPEPKR
jgi:hypothetical protein